MGLPFNCHMDNWQHYVEVQYQKELERLRELEQAEIAHMTQLKDRFKEAFALDFSEAEDSAPLAPSSTSAIDEPSTTGTSNDLRLQELTRAFEKEMALLLNRIEEEGIQNVVFLTGDRHLTELSSMVNGKGNRFRCCV